AQARDMALALLGGEGAPQAQAERIAAESDGSPFFVAELVRHLQAGAPLDEEFSLGRVLEARLLRLPPEARRLLDVVAVAGRPLGQAVAAHAAGVPDDREPLAVLRAGHFVRTRTSGELDE